MLCPKCGNELMLVTSSSCNHSCPSCGNDMTERDYDRLLEAQEVKQELGEIDADIYIKPVYTSSRDVEILPRGTVGKLKAENARLTELVEAYREYAEFLGEAFDKFTGLALSHPYMRCSMVDYRRGVEFRKKIRELEGV